MSADEKNPEGSDGKAISDSERAITNRCIGPMVLLASHGLERQAPRALMSTWFFTNDGENILLKKFAGVFARQLPSAENCPRQPRACAE